MRLARSTQIGDFPMMSERQLVSERASVPLRNVVGSSSRARRSEQWGRWRNGSPRATRTCALMPFHPPYPDRLKRCAVRSLFEHCQSLCGSTSLSGIELQRQLDDIEQLRRRIGGQSLQARESRSDVERCPRGEGYLGGIWQLAECLR